MQTISFRDKVRISIEKYLGLSAGQSLSVGIYNKGKTYIMELPEDGRERIYDMGSISKTLTAHLILYLEEAGLIDLKRTADAYLDLLPGYYPTVYELLTHTAGYGHLTPARITVPRLLSSGYARKNLYRGCDGERVIGALEARRHGKRKKHGYSYSDFPFAILALIAERVSGMPFCKLLSDFIEDKLGLIKTKISYPDEERYPLSMKGKRCIAPWRWSDNNPYIGAGGLVTTASDMVKYIALMINSDESYIKKAHTARECSTKESCNTVSCFGWHTYKKSDQLWHVGGVGTFRSSIIINKKRRFGVVVLGNSEGKRSANVHYLAKMIYSEYKVNKINFLSEKKENEAH